MSTEGLRHRLNDLLVGFWNTQAIHAAVKLNIFDVLASGPKTIHQIAKQCQIHLEGATRLVWALVSMEFVNQVEKASFELSEMGWFLVSGQPNSLTYAALMWGEEHYRAWQEIAESLRKGLPIFQKLYGKEFFTWLEDHPLQRKIYHTAMSEYASFDYRDVVKYCDFSKHQVIMDLGGGQGVLLSKILKQNPRIQAILFELPNAIGEARKYMQKQGLIDRCRLIGGNIFEKLPKGADAIILSRVLHDWDDQKAQVILQNCRQALPGMGYLYIIELCKSEDYPESSALLDLNMLIMTGGKERTQREYEELASSNGFAFLRRVDLKSVSSLLIFSKNPLDDETRLSQNSSNSQSEFGTRRR